MSNGKKFIRRDRRENQPGVVADNRAAQSRRNDLAPRNHAPSWSWITDKSAVEAACLQILRGKPGIYPIFGVQLYVEVRKDGDEQYAVLCYHDAKEGADGLDLKGLIRTGFSMSPVQLTWNIGTNTKFKTEEHELLTRTLLAQPEMQFARIQYAEEVVVAEREAARQKREAATQVREAREKRIAELRGTTAPAPSAAPASKKEYPVLSSITEILTAERGVFRHDSGVEILICEGSGEVNLIRVRRIKDEQHPLFEIMKRSAAARQDAIAYEDDPDPTRELEGVQALSRNLRQWLRSELRAAGVTLKPVVPNDTAAEEDPLLGKAQCVADSAVS